MVNGTFIAVGGILESTFQKFTSQHNIVANFESWHSNAGILITG